MGIYVGNPCTSAYGQTRRFAFLHLSLVCNWSSSLSPCLWIWRESSSLEPRSWARSRATSSCIRPRSPLSPWPSHSPPLYRDPLRALRASALGNMQWTKWILDLRTMSRRASWERWKRVKRLELVWANCNILHWCIQSTYKRWLDFYT